MVLKSLRTEEPKGLFEYVKTLQKINQNSAAKEVIKMGLERYPESIDMYAIECGFIMGLENENKLALELISNGQLQYSKVFNETLLEYYPGLEFDSRLRH